MTEFLTNLMIMFNDFFRSLSGALRRVNGVLSPVVYGTDKTSSATWDADHTQGCVCDVR